MTHDDLMNNHSRILTRARYLGIGEGWFPLIHELCRSLQDAQDLGKPQIEAVQVKEKFGGLRFYVDNASDEQYELIRSAEEASYRTCEICGRPGKLVSPRGWMKTLCDEHDK